MEIAKVMVNKSIGIFYYSLCATKFYSQKNSQFNVSLRFKLFYLCEIDLSQLGSPNDANQARRFVEMHV